MDPLQETAVALQQEWGLQLPDILSEEEILKRLAERIAAMTAKGPEAFFQLMYRLDISEQKLRHVMHEPDVDQKIARLIYDRQWEKIRSREYFRNHARDTDPDLKW